MVALQQAAFLHFRWSHFKAGLAVACIGAAPAWAEYITVGAAELVGADDVLARELARRQRRPPPLLRGYRPPDPLELAHLAAGERDAPPLPDPDLPLLEAALARGTRRRQGKNYTKEGDENTLIYKSIQLMFHAYYASQFRLKSLALVTKPYEHHELFLMAYSFKKMEAWLAAAKNMYYHIVTQHNRELSDRGPDGNMRPYEYGVWDMPKQKFTHTEQPILKWSEFLTDATPLDKVAAPIVAMERTVWRNYTLAVHMMIDITYTAEYVLYLNDMLRIGFKLD